MSIKIDSCKTTARALLYILYRKKGEKEVTFVASLKHTGRVGTSSNEK